MDGQEDVNDSAPNISDVLAVIEEDEAAQPNMGPAIHQTGYTGDVSPHSPSSSTPYIKIIEQPAAKETRFRYKCEGRSAGSIPGASSSVEVKTHPKIQIMNYNGRAVVVVSCVTKSAPYKAHPHNLVGKDCNHGVCTLEVLSGDLSISFPNLGIQCVKKKDIEEALREREEIRVDPFRTGFSHVSQPGNIDLNTVRLCFQAFIEDPVRKKLVPLQPVVSEPVHDKKAVQELTICKLSQCSASAAGGTEMILLCEKVVKEDIAVRFFEKRNGQVCWEGYGDFTPQQVHKQYGIVFKTPKYATLEFDQPINVFVELKRPSDGAASEPRPFMIYPIESGTPPFWSFRRSLFSKNSLLDNIAADIEKRKAAEDKPQQEEKTPDQACQDKTIQDHIMDDVTSSPKEIIIVDDDNNNKGNLVDDYLEQVKDLDDILPPSGDEFCPEVYTSMQMALRNPMDMNESCQGIPPPRPTAAKPRFPIRDDSDLPAPPLPPKRAKKSPGKNLPPIPEKTKLNIFQKLFCSSKRKKAKSLAGSVGSKGSTRSINSEVIPTDNKCMDLTEAEHYALYTTFAPKATLSECDDMSFYYSTVEGHMVKHQNV